MLTSESECDSEEIEKIDSQIRSSKDFFCLPLFVKPGKHHYLIKYKDTKEENQRAALKMAAKNFALRLFAGSKVFSQEEIDAKMRPELFFYSCNVTKRAEDIPPFARAGTGPTIVTRVFDYNKSVFNAWKPDIPEKLPEICELDFRFWKVGPKMIKDD